MAQIKNLKELVELVLDVGNGVSHSLADGKVSFSDAFNFKDAVFAVLPAIKDLSEVEEEYLDLDETETVELKALIASKLQLEASHESIEKIAEMILNIIVESSSLVAELVHVKKV